MDDERFLSRKARILARREHDVHPWRSTESFDPQPTAYRI